MTFLVLFSVSYNPSLGLHPRPSLRERNDYMYLYFLLIFQSRCPREMSNKTKRDFYISYWLRLPAILLMCLFDPFLIISRAHTTTGTELVLITLSLLFLTFTHSFFHSLPSSYRLNISLWNLSINFLSTISFAFFILSTSITNLNDLLQFLFFLFSVY